MQQLTNIWECSTNHKITKVEKTSKITQSNHTTTPPLFPFT